MIEQVLNTLKNNRVASVGALAQELHTTEERILIYLEYLEKLHYVEKTTISSNNETSICALCAKCPKMKKASQINAWSII